MLNFLCKAVTNQSALCLGRAFSIKMKRPGLVCYHGFTIYYTIVHDYTYNIRSFRRLKNIRILRPENRKIEKLDI